ncbi:MAG: class I SAM-dependent methyltransferase [Thermoanaerobaculia bacterium]
MTAIQRRLEELDSTLFSGIPSQSSENDRRSLLACQVAVRRLEPAYRYLEIGSHLGGSIQPHLLDDACVRIYSLDRRPASQPDARGPAFHYPENSTARMLDNLRRLAPESVAKVVCIDGDSRSIRPQAISDRPHLCFIDGEHTDRAVVADFHFSLAVLAPRGAIVFHDAEVVYNGIAESIAHLRQAGIPFRAYHLPDVLLVLEINDFPLHASPHLLPMLIDNHVGFLAALRANDHYRRFANRAPFHWLRRARAWVARGSARP